MGAVSVAAAEDAAADPAAARVVVVVVAVTANAVASGIPCGADNPPHATIPPGCGTFLVIII